MYYRNITQHILQTFRSHTTYKPYSCFVIVIIIRFYSSKHGMSVREDIMVSLFLLTARLCRKYINLFIAMLTRPLSLRNLYYQVNIRAIRWKKTGSDSNIFVLPHVCVELFFISHLLHSYLKKTVGSSKCDNMFRTKHNSWWL